jgi:DNA topoisomerase IB
VARRLGNTPPICRKCYIDPEVLLAYAEGQLARPDRQDEHPCPQIYAREAWP